MRRLVACALACSSAKQPPAPPPPPPAVHVEHRSEPRVEQAVADQLRVIDSGDLAAFRATFVPGVAITADTLAACRTRIHQVPVRPDWEMAKETVVDGLRVRRVSMFGKSMTGFHEQPDGRWLADAAWCVPVL
jgi:hypothetical protein